PEPRWGGLQRGAARMGPVRSVERACRWSRAEPSGVQLPCGAGGDDEEALARWRGPLRLRPGREREDGPRGRAAGGRPPALRPRSTLDAPQQVPLHVVPGAPGFGLRGLLPAGFCLRGLLPCPLRRLLHLLRHRLLLSRSVGTRWAPFRR